MLSILYVNYISIWLSKKVQSIIWPPRDKFTYLNIRYITLSEGICPKEVKDRADNKEIYEGLIIRMRSNDKVTA